MPRRYGYIFTQVISIDNCLKAVYEGTKNLSKSRSDVKRVLEDPMKTAIYISTIISQGWTPGPVKQTTIVEGPRRKERSLLIPSMIDHLVHVAIMLPAIPYLMKRYYYYSCGSIKGRGPARVMKALTKWIRKEHYEYAAVCDVRHFYQSVKPEVVMFCLRKIFKDQEYLALHEKILAHMAPDYVAHDQGLAIGFQPSHWYANLVLTETDRLIEHEFPFVNFVRYMDNYAMVAHDKTFLHTVIRSIINKLDELGLQLKQDWQVFPIKARALEFLSYRYFSDGRILVRKPMMYSIARKARLTSRNFHIHNVRSFISKIGIIKHAQCYTFKRKYIYPFISVKRCRRYISYVDKKCNLQFAA